jgi:predicted ribosome quality control (RQC) complex YloA/Tae2 family protein
MKTRFSTIDIAAIVPEIHQECQGLRVSQVYSLNNKTYLIRLGKQTATDGTEEIEDGGGGKLNLLLESGCRLHLTEYDWPKENAPNGFAMKLRKHLKNRRLECVRQLGMDRIVELQFGTGEAAYHIILEMYDRGNIMITDYQYTILNVLRPRKQGEDDDVKFIVREKYPIDRFVQVNLQLPSLAEVQDTIDKAKVGDNLRRIFNPKMSFGPALLEHAFIECGFEANSRITTKERPSAEKVLEALRFGQNVLLSIDKQTRGVIIQRREQIFFKSDALKSINEQIPESKTIVSYQEFHPFLFSQFRTMDQLDDRSPMPEFGKPQQVLQQFDKFNVAVDQFFSNIESQKFDQRTAQQEKDALKKLDNVRKDHERRLQDLEKRQEEDNRKGALIEMNLDLVERALLVIRSAIANQMSWQDLRDMIREAQTAGDECASSIHSLKLDQNRFVMLLKNPYEPDDENASKVDIDLDSSAYANARKYFDERKQAKKKEDKTIEASSKALKNAQIKTAQTLKEVQLKSAIIKARKVLWFEKFFWFISSDNYIVIGGRDAQQNELIVKRYVWLFRTDPFFALCPSFTFVLLFT